MRVKKLYGKPHQWFNLITDYFGERAGIIEDQESYEYVFVDDSFWNNISRNNTRSYVENFAKKISKNGNVPIIAIDHSDTPLPKFTDKDCDLFSVIIKSQCLPKDRDLMNWKVGVRYGLNRKGKLERAEDQLSQKNIEKHKLSLDLGFFRHLQGGLKEYKWLDDWKDSYDAFFMGSFNSLNRLYGLNIIKEFFNGIGHLSKLDPTHPIVGIPNEKREEESERLYKKYKHLFGENISPEEFKSRSLKSKCLPAFSGIGELGARHYQAFEYKRVLLCEDVDYLDTIFPFKHGKNYIKVKDDLEDLESKLIIIRESENFSKKIAQKGCLDFYETYENPAKLFKEYFLNYLK